MDKNHSLTIAGCLLVTLISLATVEANAQDSGKPSFDAYEKDPAERVFFTHSDSSASLAIPKKDSSAMRASVKRNVYKPAPVVPKEKNRPDDTDDDSVLSFNFLYYLIQKYKMQDIVD